MSEEMEGRDIVEEDDVVEECDVVEFTDDEGNSLLLEVVDTFFYNGDEYAVLADLEDDEDEEACEGCGHDHHHHHADGEECDGCDNEPGLYIMRVKVSTDENGEEIEEFSPVDDSMMEALIQIVQTRFMDDDDDETDGGDAE